MVHAPQLSHRIHDKIDDDYDDDDDDDDVHVRFLLYNYFHSPLSDFQE